MVYCQSSEEFALRAADACQSIIVRQRNVEFMGFTNQQILQGRHTKKVGFKQSTPTSNALRVGPVPSDTKISVVAVTFLVKFPAEEVHFNKIYSVR